MVNLLTSDILYKPASGKIYASVPGIMGNLGNSILSIDPIDGTLGTPIFVGSEPNKLAISDDGHYLYVGLDGAAAVRRVDLITQTAEIQFSLGYNSCGNFLAEDMVVLKNNPNAVAISLRNTLCSPRHQGVAIYEDGVQLPTKTPSHIGSNKIEPSDSPSILYGHDNESTDFGFRVMSIYPTGVTITSLTHDLIYGFDTDIRFDNGLIYATNGWVVDPRIAKVIGKFYQQGLVCPASKNGVVYFISEDYSGGKSLYIYNQANYYVPITNLEIPGVHGTPGSLINTGKNRLAFRTDQGQVFLLNIIENTYIYLPLITQ